MKRILKVKIWAQIPQINLNGNHSFYTELLALCNIDSSCCLQVLTSEQAVEEESCSSPDDYNNHHSSEDREHEDTPPYLQDEQPNGEEPHLLTSSHTKYSMLASILKKRKTMSQIISSIFYCLYVKTLDCTYKRHYNFSHITQ